MKQKNLWPSDPHVRALAERIVAARSIGDIDKRYHSMHDAQVCDRMTGFCASLSSALFHATGGKAGPYALFRIDRAHLRGDTHYFLVDRRLLADVLGLPRRSFIGASVAYYDLTRAFQAARGSKKVVIVDLTASQFNAPVPYHLGHSAALKQQRGGDVEPTDKVLDVLRRAGIAGHATGKAGKKASKSSSRQSADQVSPEEHHRLLASWMDQVARQETLEATTTGELAEMYAWDLGYQGERLPQRLIDLAEFEGVDVGAEHRAGILAKKNED